jgi:transposase
MPRRVIGDRAYDRLDDRLEEREIEIIAPHRLNRQRPKMAESCGSIREGGRLSAWLGKFRRLVVRYERHVENFLGFVQLGCMIILLRTFMRRNGVMSFISWVLRCCNS